MILSLLDTAEKVSAYVMYNTLQEQNGSNILFGKMFVISRSIIICYLQNSSFIIFETYVGHYVRLCIFSVLFLM